MYGNNFGCHYDQWTLPPTPTGYNLEMLLYNLQCTGWHPLKGLNYPATNVNDAEYEKQLQCKWVMSQFPKQMFAVPLLCLVDRVVSWLLGIAVNILYTKFCIP